MRSGPQRVQRPAGIVAQAQRAQPDRLDRHVREEPVEELRASLDRHFDVLHHALARRASLEALEAVADVVPPFEAHELPVRAAASVASRPEATDQRLLRTERGRAPEPVRVPAPQVVVDGQAIVGRAVVVLDRAVEDLLAGVVADRSGCRGLHAHAEVALVGAEDDPVEVVDGNPIEAARLDDAVHRLDEVGDRVEPQVGERDEGLHRFEFDAQAHRVAERPVRVGEGAEQVGVLAGRCGDHLARSGEDVELQHGLVRHPVAERRRLDAEPGDRAAERDGLQLRHDEGRQPVRQRRGDEVLVGAHAGDVGRARLGVHRDDVRQPRRVQPGGVGPGAGPEQVRSGLGQSNRGCRGHGPIALQQALDAGGVSGSCVGRGNGHATTLVPRTRRDHPAGVSPGSPRGRPRRGTS